MERENKIVAAIFVSVLIDLVGFSVIFPLYPSILDFYQKNDEVSENYVIPLLLRNIT